MITHNAITHNKEFYHLQEPSGNLRSKCDIPAGKARRDHQPQLLPAVEKKMEIQGKEAASLGPQSWLVAGMKWQSHLLYEVIRLHMNT